MSSLASRPRSRRGRHPPPGELDPVAETSEEAEAASGNLRAKPGPQDSLLPELQDPSAEPQDGSQGPGSQTDHGGLGCGVLASAPEEPSEAAAPRAPAAPQDVFEALQHALGSLEVAATAWRHRSPSSPGLREAEDGDKGGPGPFGDQDEARHGRHEAARLTERNAWLRLALGSREAELVRTQAVLQATQVEKETLQSQVQELQNTLMQLETSWPPSLPAGGPGSDSSSSGAEGEPWTPQGSPLVHPMLQCLQRNSSTQIFGCLSTQRRAPETHLMEDQLEQLQGSIENLKCFNRLLLAVLQGYKGRCESLSMQLGLREAEATALHLALQYSEDCEEAFGALLALRMATKDRATEGDLQAAEDAVTRLLAEKEAAMDGGTPQPSPEGSSVDKPTPQELVARLHGHVQRVQEHRALVKIPPALGPVREPRPTVPHTEASVMAMLEMQPGPALPRLEKSQIQQDLLATREGLADLALRLQLLRKEKRGLELREAALRTQGPALALLLQQLRWERAHLGACGVQDSSGRGSSGDASSEEEEWAQGPPALPGGQTGRVWDSENLSQELAASLTRTLELQAQLQALRWQLEQMAQKGRIRRAHSAELNRELCKAHSALVLAFRGAHRKQEEQSRKLEQQMTQMQARQAEELAALEATARSLGKPGPQPGETFL
ncbi:Usher syndrome type-1C protein-binding protein 1 isoform X2 [Nannospalax galili]|uniref:Usher syndrome type-1C protein-binding protein 1 isoform X2 n=1 Tax=Nannospalax galili TaxID=1026970 RepID=UPI000819FE2E|nr:Usher syndrome type-1C protein-binding protein 1 isoform X2 [Nannospalax galili]XP_029415172.1 Usher syndrome type-1C protein-binding protein 1 isoform X2 [Nannospalax galili]